MFALLIGGGCGFWMLHARAWSLGDRSPVLSYDAAEYAVAARELASHGRLATTFALPIELARHPSPPWPLAVVQPGLVLSEALIFKLVPPEPSIGGRQLYQLRRPDQREWLVLMPPFACFLGIAAALALLASHALRRHAPGTSIGQRAAAGTALGLAFLLDPEAQHLATGGFTELPFTAGLLAAVAALALEHAPRWPLLFGLVLGFTGLFRGNMLWFAPIFALAAAALAPGPRRARVFALTLLGYALLLAPWWIYKWRAFGSPAWDLSALSVWDGVGGRTWFSIFHLPAEPDLPRGGEALRLITAKTMANLPRMLLLLGNGLRALLIGALVIWLVAARPPRPLRIAARVALALVAVSVVVAAMSEPLLRYVFPTRVLVEAAGVLALWDLIGRAPTLSRAGIAALRVALAVLVIGWGAWQTARGNAEARAVSRERGVPSTLTLLQITVLLNREVPAGEPVMSNLGPGLAWEARRPVIHLALTPDALTDCRRRVNFRNVLLVFRDPSRAWPGWTEVLQHPAEAPHRPEWNVRRVRRFDSPDGFMIVWLELGPRAPELAAR